MKHFKTFTQFLLPHADHACICDLTEKKTNENTSKQKTKQKTVPNDNRGNQLFVNLSLAQDIPLGLSHNPLLAGMVPLKIVVWKSECIQS